MRLIVRQDSIQRILKWSQRGLFACAILLLGYCGFALVDAWLFQKRESAYLDSLVRDRPPAGEVTPPSGSAAAARILPAAARDGLIGRLEIPRLHLSLVVVEGISKKTLRRAVGHIPGTVLPGEPGAVGLAGHRDTFFRPLKDLKIQDEIQFSTPKGNFKYVVVSLSVAEPGDIGVLAPSAGNALTLVTCYPFYFVGPAPKRWIVRARQVSSQALATSIVK